MPRIKLVAGALAATLALAPAAHADIKLACNVIAEEQNPGHGSYAIIIPDIPYKDIATKDYFERTDERAKVNTWYMDIFTFSDIQVVLHLDNKNYLKDTYIWINRLNGDIQTWTTGSNRREHGTCSVVTKALF